jgi:hypothetical protein
MFRRLLTISSLVASAIMLAGCATQNQLDVSSHFDPLAAFPAQARYVWDVRSNSMPQDPRLRTKENDLMIRGAVDDQFMARGYRPVENGPFEYRLSYQFAAYNFHSAEQSTSVGTISLELVEASTGRRVWTGYAQANLYVGSTEEESRARLGEGIGRMLANFPPSQRAPK